MLLPAEMSKITILLHKKDSDKLIKKLHESGLMEITKAKNEFYRESKMNPLVGECAHYELRIARIIDILKSYERKKGLKDILKQPEIKKIKVRKRSLEEKIKDAKKLLEEIEEDVIKKEQEIERLGEKKDELKSKIEKLKYLSLFNIDIAWLGKSKYVIIKFGISDKPIKIENAIIYSKPIGKKKEKFINLIVAPSYMEEKILKVKIEEIYLEGKGFAKDLLKETKKELKKIEEKKKELIKEMRNIYEKRKIELFAMKEEIEIEKKEKEVQQYFGESNFTFLIEGWSLSENVEKLKKIVEETTNRKCSFHARRAKRNPDEAPIYLKNPEWAKPFETFLRLFSLPKYNEVNPTLFIGISFIIFFSFMLGDAGYGLIILILSLIAYLKFKRSKFIRQWSFVGIWLGLGNLCTGFLFNGFFGDFIPRFIYNNPDKLLYHANVFGISIPIDAIHKPVIILGIALLLGLIHLNMGIMLGLYQNLKRRHIKSVFMEQLPWFLLQIGGGMLIGASLLRLWHINHAQKIFAYVLTIMGLVILFKDKGALGFFDITGYLGDWLSYARLLALGLATAGMALAFNIVSQLLPTIIPYVGIVLVPIVLIITHLANLLIQSLGAAIHALRLQYVEFFNRFYEGGGKKFKPFSISRKYTEEIK